MPILNPDALEFFSRSPGQTRRLGIRLGALLRTGDLLCLSGDLGAGKTTFVQGLAKGWGSLDLVTSPTFVLHNLYGRPDGQTLHHLDAYRLQSELEAEELDLFMMLETGALVVEWPENIRGALPQDNLTIELRWVADEQRNMLFIPGGKRYYALLKTFQQQAFGGSHVVSS